MAQGDEIGTYSSDWLLFDSYGADHVYYAMSFSLSGGTFTADSPAPTSGSTQLPQVIEVPAAYNIFGLGQPQSVAIASNGSTVLSWDSNYGTSGFVTPSSSIGGILSGSSPGMALLSPSAAQPYDGISTDWLMYVSTGSPAVTAETSLLLSTVTFAQNSDFATASSSVTFTSMPTFTVGFSTTPPFEMSPNADESFTIPTFGTTTLSASTSSNNYSNVYTYDLNSNRLSQVHTGPGDTAALTALGTATYSYYNSDDELISQLSPGTAGYSFSYSPSTYDANGSMTDQYTGASASNNAFGAFTTNTATVATNVSTDAATVVSTGSVGMVITSISSNNSTANAEAVVLNTGGTATAILVAGSAVDADSNRDILLAEYNPTTGQPISTFGSGGFVLTGFGDDTSATANAVTVLSSGNILVAGSANVSSTQYLLLAEYSSTGSLITSFGTSGIRLTNIGGAAAANAVTLLSSGTNTYILVAGYGTVGGQQEIAVAEYNTSGTLVSTFGSSGITLTADGDTPNGNAIVVDGNSIWMAGGSEHNCTAVLVQYSTSGAFDQLVRSAVANNAYWSSMAVSGTNVLVAGVAGSGTLALAEYNQYGSPVMSFGTNGVVLINLGGNATANAIMVETSGKILVSGCGTYSGNGRQEFIVAQYNSNGSLDPTFGVNGVAMPMAASGATLPSEAYTEAILPSGALAVAGQIEDSSGGHEDIFVAEYSVAAMPSSTYGYDVRNKMVGFSGATGTASYVYDNSGNRVQEKTGGTTSFYLTDTANPTGYAQPIEVWTSTNGSLSSATLNTSYLIGDRVFGQDVSGTLAYLSVDGQDNTRLLTSGTGAISAVYNYDAFGDGLNFNVATAPTLVLFQQTMYDPVSGLNLYGDATRGAEPGEDSYIETDGQGYSSNSNPITLNLVLLDNADPTNGTDATGHDYDDDYLDEADDAYGQALGVVGSLEALQAADSELEDLDSNQNAPGINQLYTDAFQQQGNASRQVVAAGVMFGFWGTRFIDMTNPATWPTPPGKGPFTEGPASRPSEAAKGGESLYDTEGGEWRPHLPDSWHPDAHWNYKPPGKNAEWLNLDENGNRVC